jgi:hypothetical protein
VTTRGRKIEELEHDLERLQIKYEGMVRAFRDIGELAKQRERDLAVLFDIHPEAEDELERHWAYVALEKERREVEE